MKPEAIREELLNLKASLSLGMSKVEMMLQQFEKKESKTSNTATLNKILAKRRKTLIK